MVDPPPNIAVLQPWILRKHLSLGWTPQGAWVGELKFNIALLRSGRPQDASRESVKKAVSYLTAIHMIGPSSAEGRKKSEGVPLVPEGKKKKKKGKSSAPPPAGDKATGSSRAARGGAAQSNAPNLGQQGSTQNPEASSSMGSYQSEPWDAPNLRSQYSPDTAHSADKTYFDQYDSWEGVPVNIQTPRQQRAKSISDGPTHTNKANVEVNWELEEGPKLDDQLELLGLDDSDDDPSLGGKLADKEIKDAVLFGAPLLTGEDSERTKDLIPQYGLLGSVLQTKLQDTRIFLNSNNPASFFICGLQGSGKSHTLSTILENYLIPSPKLGILRKPLSGLVLHFGEFNSRDAFRPCEAAYLASPDSDFADGRSVRGVTVLVSPSNYQNLKASYCGIPGVTVRRLKLRSRDLTIQSMLTLMSVDSSTNPPLYMAQVTKVLRDMAASGGEFDYINFTSRLDEVDLIPGQRRMLDQRLELLESFLDLESFDGGCFDNIDSGQQLMIVDLSCPFVDASAACVLFNICIGLFLAASKAEKLGKVIAVDEAHKYMTDTPASKILTEQLLSIIRQQRHYAARVIIATQEPTISPRLMDLASATIIHRFNSPEWFNTLRKHLSIANGGGQEAKDLFARIIKLRTGEALVFAPSALLKISGDIKPKPDDDAKVGEGVRANGMMKMNSEFFRMKVRRRITADGGATIRSL